jgi:hypothetical protein
MMAQIVADIPNPECAVDEVGSVAGWVTDGKHDDSREDADFCGGEHRLFSQAHACMFLRCAEVIETMLVDK